MRFSFSGKLIIILLCQQLIRMVGLKTFGKIAFVCIMEKEIIHISLLRK